MGIRASLKPVLGLLIVSIFLNHPYPRDNSLGFDSIDKYFADLYATDLWSFLETIYNHGSLMKAFVYFFLF